MLLNSQDGIDHINIYSKGKSTLGKRLTNMFPFNFTFDGLIFKSVEHAWHYYKFIDYNPDVATQIFETNSPYDALKIARANATEDTSSVVLTNEFRSLIKEVIKQRIMEDESLIILLRNSWLPFEHYYVYGADKIQDQSDKYAWLIYIFDDIRAELHFEYLDSLLSKYGNLCYNMQTAPANSIYVGRSKIGVSNIYGNPFPVPSNLKLFKNGLNHHLFERAVALSVMEFRHHLIEKLKAEPTLWYGYLLALKQQPLKCFCTNGTDSREKGAAFCHTLILGHFADNIDSIYKTLGLNTNG